MIPRGMSDQARDANCVKLKESVSDACGPINLVWRTRVISPEGVTGRLASPRSQGSFCRLNYGAAIRAEHSDRDASRALHYGRRAACLSYLSGLRRNVTPVQFCWQIHYNILSLRALAKRNLMVLYHRGAAIQPSITRQGNTFVARVCILNKDASSNSAYTFAVRSATAFVDGEPIPRCPFDSTA
jgi:hypothetical protein